MGCFAPIRVWQLKGRTPKGARLFVFRPTVKDVVIDKLRVPCGRCDGCKYDYCRDWSTRAEMEFCATRRGCFVTLTYDAAHLPSNGSLVFRDLQLFFKRLRKAGVSFRYFACGEYGEKFFRPHYHACIFGYDFPDRIFWSTRKGRAVYKSALLERTWSLGISEVMDFVPQAAAYVAGYVLKKQGRRLDFFRLPGNKVPEFLTMSRGNPGGLGISFIRKYSSELHSGFFINSDGQRRSLPRFVISKLPPDVVDRIRTTFIADSDGVVIPEVTQDELDVRAELFRARTRRAGQSRIYEEDV